MSENAYTRRYLKDPPKPVKYPDVPLDPEPVDEPVEKKEED